MGGKHFLKRSNVKTKNWRGVQLSAGLKSWTAKDGRVDGVVAHDRVLLWAAGIQYPRRNRKATMNGRRTRRGNYLQLDPRGRTWVDYKNVDELRRLMTPNGKIYSRKRLGTTSNDQRKVAKAIKRARYMAILPYTDGTL